MGDPKFSRAKYSGPSHPWQAERIKEEKDLAKKYGLKNKKELWKAQSVLRRYRQNARNLQARLRTAETQAEMEREEFISKLQRQGFFSDNATLDDVLALELESILNRRLQTIVHLKGLAYTPKQARQMIIHGHINLGGRKVTIPSYHVKLGEDEEIEYRGSSPFTDDLHPMRPKPEMERELEKAEVASEAPAGTPAQPPAEEKPAKEKPLEEKPKEQKPAAEKPKEQKPAAEKPKEQKPAAEKPKEEEAPKDLKVAPGGDE